VDELFISLAALDLVDQAMVRPARAILSSQALRPHHRSVPEDWRRERQDGELGGHGTPASQSIRAFTTCRPVCCFTSWTWFSSPRIRALTPPTGIVSKRKRIGPFQLLRYGRSVRLPLMRWRRRNTAKQRCSGVIVRSRACLRWGTAPPGNCN